MQMTDAFTPPPHDIEAEAALIASVLSSEEFLLDAVSMVPTPDFFYRDSHQRLWAIILDFQRAGTGIDGVTVGAECDRRGISFLDELSASDALYRMLHDQPLNYYAVEYAARIVQAARLRALIETANGMLADCYKNRDEPDAILQRALKLLKGEESKSDADTETAGRLIPDVLQRLDDRAAGRLTGVMTPWEEINRLTGGLQCQDLVVVAARTSMGKTSFCLNLAAFAAIDNDVPTLVVSLEMSNASLVERILAFRSNTHVMAMRTGRLDNGQMQRMNQAQYDLNSSPLHLARKPGRTLPRIMTGIRRAQAKFGIKLVIIDYIQQINSGHKGSLYETTTMVAKELKDLANDLGVPVVALSQLSRITVSREGKRPQMTDLRDSGAIEEAADLIMLLHRPDYYDPKDEPGIAEVALVKNRNGPPGETRLRFHREVMQFEDVLPRLMRQPDIIALEDFGRPPEKHKAPF